MAMTFSRWNDNQRIPKRMRVLERWVKTYADEKPLAGVTMLLIQHQLGHHVLQARALLKLGLDPRRLFWLDIPYTATPKVRRCLIKLGIPAKNLKTSRGYRVLDPYSPYQRRRVQNLLLQFLEERVKHLVVLDDGAYFLEALACFRRRLPRVAIVEQTTRGLIKIDSSAALKKCAQEVPLINVARSKPKKTLEAPFIGHSVCTALRRKLGKRFRVSHGDQCLVLGFGVIGRQVAVSMRELGFNPAAVFVHDTNRTRLQEARQLGFGVWDRTILEARFRLVVGCSGRSSFSIGDYVYLKDGAVLASASSGSEELSREEFIDLAASHSRDDIAIERRPSNVHNVHSKLHLRLPDRRVTFLNGGFPVNFDGRANCVPAHYIQPTPTMMVAGAVQAAQATQPGRVRLDPRFCRWINREFRKELGPEASILP